jgi:predicted deacylase
MTAVYQTIGTVGQAWGDKEKQLWLKEQSIKRSYHKEVLAKLVQLEYDFERINYGHLTIDSEQYPLYAMLSKQWQENRKNILVTGGVHGYETSGVQGAIRFLQTYAKALSNQYNIIVIPCVSPWSFETVNRWNHLAIDPNRSFYTNSPAEESSSLMAFLNKLNVCFEMHIDLHETTDTDNTTFRPALAARDAVEQKKLEHP